MKWIYSYTLGLPLLVHVVPVSPGCNIAQHMLWLYIVVRLWTHDTLLPYIVQYAQCLQCCVMPPSVLSRHQGVPILHDPGFGLGQECHSSHSIASVAETLLSIFSSGVVCTRYLSMRTMVMYFLAMSMSIKVLLWCATEEEPIHKHSVRTKLIVLYHKIHLNSKASNFPWTAAFARLMSLKMLQHMNSATCTFYTGPPCTCMPVPKTVSIVMALVYKDCQCGDTRYRFWEISTSLYHCGQAVVGGVPALNFHFSSDAGYCSR